MYYLLMLTIKIPDKIQSPKVGQQEREREKNLALLIIKHKKYSSA